MKHILTYLSVFLTFSLVGQNQTSNITGVITKKSGDVAEVKFTANSDLSASGEATGLAIWLSIPNEGGINDDVIIVCSSTFGLDTEATGFNVFNYEGRRYYIFRTITPVNLSSWTLGSEFLIGTFTLSKPDAFRAPSNVEEITLVPADQFGAPQDNGVGGFAWNGTSLLQDNANTNLVEAAASTAILPVELSTFKAEKQEKFSALSWETSSEINNDYFDIERSHNAKDFVSIGRVQGNGTTNDIQNYDFLDRNPLSGKNYYRLKQVDYNGAYEYSNIESVDFSDGRGDLEVFPNPAMDFVTIAVDRTYEKIKVVNNLGQLVKTIPSTKLDGNEIKLNISDYTPGLYFLEAKIGTEILNKQFVKVK